MSSHVPTYIDIVFKKNEIELWKKTPYLFPWLPPLDKIPPSILWCILKLESVPLMVGILSYTCIDALDEYTSSKYD